MNIRRTSALAALGLCTLVGVVAYRVGRARADGVPTASPLYYGGVLDDGGRPVEGTRNVTIRLWDMAVGGTAACTTVAPNTPFGAGRFRVEMDAACAAAFRANPNLWAEVLVDSTTFARTKVGAVPYALEAGRAAAASGALEARIAAVEALAQPRQVQIGPSGGTVSYTGTPANETAELPVTGTSVTFTPRVAGMFAVSCHCTVQGQASLSIRVLSTPAPMNFVSHPATANTFYTVPNNPIGTVTTPVVIDAVGLMQGSVPYTIQVQAALTATGYYYGSSTRYPTSSVTCGRVTITQLN